MAYRSINQNFSDDEYIAGLPKDGKLAALALILGKASHFSGIYHVRPDVLAVEWAFTPEEITGWLQRFTQDGWAHFDAATNTVWVRSMFAHQTYQEMTAPQCAGAVKHVRTLRNSILIAEWWHYYEPALKAAGFEYPWGTLPPTLGDTLSPTLLRGWEGRKGGSGLGLDLSTNKVKDKGSPSAPAPGVESPNAPLKVRIRSKTGSVKKSPEKSPAEPKTAKRGRRKPATDWTKVPVNPEALGLAEHMALKMVDLHPDHLSLTDARRDNTIAMWGKTLEEVLGVAKPDVIRATIDFALSDAGDKNFRGWKNIVTGAHTLVNNWDKIRAAMAYNPVTARVAPPTAPTKSMFDKKEVPA